MASTRIFIRHMVCSKCILVVREHLLDLGLTPLRVELGEVEVLVDSATINWPRLRQRLEMEGFAILDQSSPQQRLVAQIKAIIADLLRNTPSSLRSGYFSQQLSQRLHQRFAHLSDVFSALEGISLEQFVMRQRVEAARQLLETSPLTVSRIARQLGYSSLGHLSRQFQRETGTTPSSYRRDQLASHSPQPMSTDPI
jgi:AraC family transcriptional regulator